MLSVTWHKDSRIDGIIQFSDKKFLLHFVDFSLVNAPKCVPKYSKIIKINIPDVWVNLPTVIAYRSRFVFTKIFEKFEKSQEKLLICSADYHD